MKILQDGKEVSTIDFGEVELGARKEIIIELENEGEGALTELAFKVNPEIQILAAPHIIAPHSKSSLRLSWMPDANLKQPIQVNLEITGKEVFG